MTNQDGGTRRGVLLAPHSSFVITRSGGYPHSSFIMPLCYPISRIGRNNAGRVMAVYVLAL